VFESKLSAPPHQVWEFHASAKALHALTPPGQSVEVDGDPEVREGALHVLCFRRFGLPMRWHARIRDVHAPHGFTDVAERSIFRAWRHQHEFLADGSGTLLRDTVTYEPPGGPFAGLIDRLIVKRELTALFRFRHDATRKALAGSVDA